MAETKFTPGPWTAKPDPGGHVGEWLILVRAGDDFRSVVTDIDNEADAHLIAAAPDLYEALAPFVAAFRAARERYARRHGQALTRGRQRFDQMPGEWPMDTLVFTMEDFRHAEAALAKATP